MGTSISDLGGWVGAAAAAKFYPFLLLGPLLVLCWRAGRMNAFARVFGGAIGAWLVINVPFMLINFDGWARFYTFSSERGEDFGSVWLLMTNIGIGLPASVLNKVATGLFLPLCVGIAVLALGTIRRPRFAQLAFLVVAAFVITNKVYFTAICAVADPARCHGSPAVARLPDLASWASRLLRSDLAVPSWDTPATTKVCRSVGTASPSSWRRVNLLLQGAW